MTQATLNRRPWLAAVFALLLGLTNPPAYGVAARSAQVEHQEPTETATPPDQVSMELVTSLPATYEVRRHVVWINGRQIPEGDVAAQRVGDSKLVYSNTLGPVVFAPSTAGSATADDIITIAADDCLLDRFVFRVSGNSDGTGVGPFSVEYALYDSCPGATLTPIPIPGTAGTFDAPDNGIYEVEVVILPDTDVKIPTQLYFGLKFSRTKAGVVIGAPALIGFSSDRFDFPPFSKCATRFGFGFPVSPHSSFYAQIYVRGDCPSRFPIYSNTQNAATPYSLAQQTLFADDIAIDTAQLGGVECLLGGYEVALKASTPTGTGAVEVDLRGFLDLNDPANGGLILGTRKQIPVAGDRVQKLRVTFDPPLSLASVPDPSRLFVVFKASSALVGPILTCRESNIGKTQDFYQIFRNGSWEVDDAGPFCHAAFDVTLFCAGSPPVGACCDMVLTENKECIAGPRDGLPCTFVFDCDSPNGRCAGDSICRDVPRINCPFPTLWARGTVCDSTCQGGVNNGQACTRQIDCPDGECPGSFPGGKPCGLARCCRYNDSCDNVTEKDCFGEPPIESSKVNFFRRGEFCNEELNCPFGACLGREGECTMARPALCVGGTENAQVCDPQEPWFLSACIQGGGACSGQRGCKDAFCCTLVCEADAWCCRVEWDTMCVRGSANLCAHGPPNDVCASTSSEALQVDANGSAVVDGTAAREEPGSPGFCGYTGLNPRCSGGPRNGSSCCTSEECFGGVCLRDSPLPGSQGKATVWFKFVATHTSARIDTCNSDFDASDTILGVYRPSDPSTPETACNTLVEIGCSDDAPGCGYDVASDLCVDGLNPGETYYVQVAAKSDCDRGVIELNIESPCPAAATASQGIALTGEQRPVSMAAGESPARWALGPTTPSMNVSLLSAVRPFEPGAPGNPAVGREMPQLVRIDVADISQLRTLAAFHNAHRDVEIWSEALGIGPIDVRLPSHTRQALDATGLSYRVLVEDLNFQRQGLMGATAGADFFDAYRSYEEHVVFMNDLVTAYPNLAQMVNLGSSVQGRILWALRITAPGADKPAVLYHGAQHGNEIMGAANIAFIARRLLADYGTDSRVTALVDHVEWFLLPMMNPDGYEQGNRYNANGFDLNRNWGGPGAPPDPFSQPETAALRDFVTGHPNVRAHVDLHSYGFMILWPWGHTAELSENHVTFDSLGTEMAGRITDVRGTQYPYRGPIYTTIYPVNGGSIDYSYGELGLWSFAFEIGYAFYMSTSEIIPTGEEMFQSLAFLAEWVFDCNGNGVADADEIARGESDDCNQNKTPDECEQQPDFDADGEVDICDADIDNDGVLNAGDMCDRTSLGTLVDTEGRPPSDTNNNCEVDLDDFWRFRNCMIGGRRGAPAPVEPCRRAFDADDDDAINLRDFAVFQRAFSAP